ncbi:MAG: cupin domain-containing protein [Sphingobium sp.]
MSERNLADYPVHLGPGGTALEQPRFTGMEWYAAYEATHGADGADGRLVSLYDFTEDWTSWERHPAGAELVICTAGAMTIIQQLPDGGEAHIPLGPGDYAINPPGVWHTADITGTGAAIFITPGFGTDHRPR